MKALLIILLLVLLISYSACTILHTGDVFQCPRNLLEDVKTQLEECKNATGTTTATD